MDRAHLRGSHQQSEEHKTVLIFDSNLLSNKSNHNTFSIVRISRQREITFSVCCSVFLHVQRNTNPSLLR